MASPYQDVHSIKARSFGLLYCTIPDSHINPGGAQQMVRGQCKHFTLPAFWQARVTVSKHFYIYYPFNVYE